MMQDGNENSGGLTPFQERCVAAIRQAPNSMAELGYVARRVASSRIAVHSALAALQRRGLADCFRSGNDRWAVQIWFLTGNLRKGVE